MTATPAHLLPVRWEDLTAHDFPEAVRRAQRTCILPIGCLERHGDHLPLGTDVFEARAVAEEAARLEPAVVFPSYYVAQIACARHQPGTISYSQQVRWAMLEETVDECVRNGFTRILILNGHGGNIHFLKYFTQCQLERRRDAQVFAGWPWDHDEVTRSFLVDSDDHHGGEMETSLMQHIAPQLVRRDLLGAPGRARERAPVLRHPGLANGLWWYARYPDHYAGDGNLGSADKGARLFTIYAGRVAAMLRAIKQDTEVAALAAEFNAASADPLA